MAKLDEVDGIIAKLNKKYGRDVIVRGSNAKGVVLHKVSSGSVSLDIDLGGGVALGRLNQISGQYSSGKSVLCAKIAANFLDNKITPSAKSERKRLAIYVDLEHTFDQSWVSLLGVDMKRFLICSPFGAEETIDLLCEMLDIATGSEIDTISFIDSLAGLIPLVDIEETSDKTAGIAAHARTVSKSIKKILPRLKRAITSLSLENSMVFVNQTRMNPMVMYGDKESETGGKSPGYFSSQIIRVRRGQPILHEKKPVGYTMPYLVVKEKTGGDERITGEATFYRTAVPEIGVSCPGFDDAFDVLPYAFRIGTMEQRGAMVYLNGRLIGRSRESAAVYLRQHPDILREVVEDTLRECRTERIRLRKPGKEAMDHAKAQNDDAQNGSGGDSGEGGDQEEAVPAARKIAGKKTSRASAALFGSIGDDEG